MPNLRGASPVGRGEGGRRARQRCRTPGESARERGGAFGAGRGVVESQRAGRVARNTMKAGGGVLGRCGAVRARSGGQERSGPT